VSIPKIADLKNKTATKSTPLIKADKSLEIKNPERKNEFSTEQLHVEWENFANQLKKDRKDNEFNLMIQKYELLENQKILIHINNSIEQDILLRFKTELLKYLRDKLDNDQITIDTALKKVKRSEKIYTNTDKFKHLTKKNPNLLTLKNIFGLDPEF
jgi:DNA polymerase-3 subunit gamma/tau